MKLIELLEYLSHNIGEETPMWRVNNLIRVLYDEELLSDDFFSISSITEDTWKELLFKEKMRSYEDVYDRKPLVRGQPTRHFREWIKENVGRIDRLEREIRDLKTYTNIFRPFS